MNRRFSFFKIEFNNTHRNITVFKNNSIICIWKPLPISHGRYHNTYYLVIYLSLILPILCPSQWHRPEIRDLGFQINNATSKRNNQSPSSRHVLPFCLMKPEWMAEERHVGPAAARECTLQDGGRVTCTFLGCHTLLTHLTLDKMAAILQTKYSDAF